MANRLSYFVLCVFIGMLSVSCLSPRALTRQLNKTKVTLGYISETEPNQREKKVFVSVAEPAPSTMHIAPIVRVTNSSLIPVIIYTGWKNEFSCSMGRSQITGDPDKFVYDSFIEEVNRSAYFGIDSLSDVHVNFDIESLEVKGPYVNTGFFLYFVYLAVWGTQDYMGPSTATCSIKYTVSKGDRILSKRSIVTTSMLEPLRVRRQMDPTLLRVHYTIVMGEQLSEAIRMNVEKGIKMIESELSLL